MARDLFKSAVTVVNQTAGGVFAHSLGQFSQSFKTQPLSNTRMALFALSIRSPKNSAQAYATYTFPISPAAVSKEYTSMTNIYDVQGSPTQSGVQRIVDIYGNSPVTFQIEGTTGWKFHQADGFQFSGVDSIAVLQDFLQTYAQLNQTQSNGNQPLYTLEFYDFFNSDFWQIEPIGRQEVRQSRDRPQILNYSFRFAGIVDLNNPPPDIADKFAQRISTPGEQVVGILGNVVGDIISNYAAVTLGSHALTGFLG